MLVLSAYMQFPSDLVHPAMFDMHMNIACMPEAWMHGCQLVLPCDREALLHDAAVLAGIWVFIFKQSLGDAQRHICFAFQGISKTACGLCMW